MNTHVARRIEYLTDSSYDLPPFSAVQHNALCDHCKLLNAAVMASRDGQPHAESIEALQRSARVCPLCNCLYADNFAEIRSGRGNPGDNSAVCRLGLCERASHIYLTFGGRLGRRSGVSNNRVFAMQGMTSKASTARA